MSFDPNKQSFSTSIDIQKGSKKDTLWNTVEPDDHYDISKSMIAKLPGAKKTYMGDNIEVICLFQAAEIKRLTDSLDQYRLKYKGVSKSGLDRHSFQVQIQQLAKKIQENQSLNTENQKLKQFIKKQGSQLQDWRNKASNTDTNLQTKYHKALKQLQIFHKDNAKLKQQYNAIKKQLIEQSRKQQNLQRYDTSLLEPLQKSLQFQRISQKKKKQIGDSGDEFSHERNQLEIQLKKVKQAFQQKNKEAIELDSKINQMYQKLGELANAEQRNYEYEQKIVLATQEIQRLNQILKDKNAEVNEIQSVIQDYQIRFHMLEDKGDGQQNLRLSANTIERLNNKLQIYKDRIASNDSETVSLKKKIKKLYQEDSGLGEQVKNSQTNIKSNTHQSKSFRKLQQYKFRLEEIDRENNAIKNKVGHLLEENQQIGDKVRHVQAAKDSLRLTVLQNKKTIQQLNEYKSQLSKYSEQGQMKQQQIQTLSYENQRLRKELKNIQESLYISHTQHLQISQQLKKHKIRIQQILVQNETRNRAMKNINEQNKYLQQQTRKAEQKLQFNSYQSQKQNNQLLQYKLKFESKSQELQTFRQEYKLRLEQKDQQLQTFRQEYKLRLGLKSQQLQTIRQQYKLDLQSNRQEYQLRIEQNRQEKQLHLQSIKKQFEDQKQQYKLRLEQKQQRIQTYKQEIKSSKSIGNIKRDEFEMIQQNLKLSAGTVVQLSNELALGYKQKEDLKNKLKQFEAMENKYTRSENKIAGLNEQIAKLNLKIENKSQEVTNLNYREIEEMNQKIDNSENKISKLMLENSHMQIQIKKIQQNLRLSTDQNDKIKKQLSRQRQQRQYIKQRQGNVGNNEQYELMRLKIQKLMDENTELGDEVTIKQQNLKYSMIKITKLSDEFKIVSNQNDQLVLRIGELNKLIDKKNKQIISISENCSEIDSLNARIRQLTQKLQKTTRSSQSLYGQGAQEQGKFRFSHYQIQSLEAQINAFRQENNIIRRKASDQADNYQKKVVEYENKITISFQQNERLNTLVANKEKQISKLQKKLSEIDEMNKQIGSFHQKISKLVNENADMEDEIRSARENLRLSTNQNQKMARQLNQYKMKIQQNNIENQHFKHKITKLQSQNQDLNQEVEAAQEGLRLSAYQQEKLNRQLKEYKDSIQQSNRQSETFHQKIKKLTSQNNSLNQEVTTAQDNLRLSANQIFKLKNQYSLLCNENQELKFQLSQQSRAGNKKSDQLVEKINQLTSQIQRLKLGEREHTNTKNKLIEYETKLERVTQQFQKLSSTISELKIQNISLKQTNYELEHGMTSFTSHFSSDKINILNQEISRLSKQVEEKEEDLSQLKLRFSDESSLFKRNREHLGLFVVLFAEIQSLRKRLKNKENQVEDVRRSSLAPYRKQL